METNETQLTTKEKLDLEPSQQLAKLQTKLTSFTPNFTDLLSKEITLKERKWEKRIVDSSSFLCHSCQQKKIKIERTFFPTAKESNIDAYWYGEYQFCLACVSSTDLGDGTGLPYSYVDSAKLAELAKEIDAQNLVIETKNYQKVITREITLIRDKVEVKLATLKDAISNYQKQNFELILETNNLRREKENFSEERAKIIFELKEKGLEYDKLQKDLRVLNEFITEQKKKNIERDRKQDERERRFMAEMSRKMEKLGVSSNQEEIPILLSWEERYESLKAEKTERIEELKDEIRGLNLLLEIQKSQTADAERKAESSDGLLSIRDRRIKDLQIDIEAGKKLLVLNGEKYQALRKELTETLEKNSSLLDNNNELEKIIEVQGRTLVRFEAEVQELTIQKDTFQSENQTLAEEQAKWQAERSISKVGVIKYVQNYIAQKTGFNQLATNVTFYSILLLIVLFFSWAFSKLTVYLFSWERKRNKVLEREVTKLEEKLAKYEK